MEKQKRIEIAQLAANQRDVSREVAAVFVDDYEKDLAFLSNKIGINTKIYGWK
ncbi:hypothetical protein HUG20_13585 [Salicibibacter cibi]|uniref:Uncharacterized protein n=1 Tax=Salicibibacter cibi TaxID=2743001 RepID=A0A7T7CG54_9BACI|nr:hypothetical protein [Salicibibacter cibi]QQK80825.1 hypothetical protein HUG20_13585 [Salicibibacter cibi]